MLTPAFILLSLMLLLPIIRGQYEVILFTFLAFLAGSALYPFMQYCREKGWFTYSSMTPEDFKVGHQIYLPYMAYVRLPVVVPLLDK